MEWVPALVGSGITIVVLALTFAYNFGRLYGRVEQLQKTIEDLQEDVRWVQGALLDRLPPPEPPRRG